MKTDHFTPEAIGKLTKLVVFCSLAVVGGTVLINNWNTVYEGIPVWYVVLPAVFLLLAENAVKMWGVKRYTYKIACYVLDILLLLTITVYTNGMLISTFYILILSEFYITQESLKWDIIMGAVSIGLFLTTLAVCAALRENSLDVIAVVTSAFNDLVLLILHFFIVNFAVQIYRKNREITQVLGELSERNEELKKLNEEVKTITALEERQRIAKEIHDTAGHSITTVIMQTEAARLCIDTDTEDAKRKISAANLQAKHALEELRESVHLLSGAKEHLALKDALIGIIHESTDGTGIAIRYDIDDISLCDSKRRFLLGTLKEGISNGLRHGGATAFWFELKDTGKRIEFLLSDNGSGLELSDLKEGFGLSGMQARAEALGGRVWFETEPSEGFEIHMTLPPDGDKGAV